METWQLVLYAVASVLALRSLSSLMTGHRNRVRRKLAIKMAHEQQQKTAQLPESQGNGAKRPQAKQAGAPPNG